jgi:dihydrolipoamide dehydrogenase
VTLLDVMPTILPLEDSDVSAELARSFKKRKIDVITKAQISNVKVGKKGVTFSVEAGGAKQDVEVDVVLVAAGRAPNVENLGLDKAGVKLNDKGFIEVDTKT